MTRAARWARTPKGLTLLGLLALLAIAAPARGVAAVGLALLVAALAAGVDLLLTRYLGGGWTIPDGGAITGLLVALVVDSTAPVAALVVGVVGGLVVKHVVRTRWSNVFNPAAAGLVIACLIPGGGVQSWWGALTDLPAWSVLFLLAAGAFIADRENKLPAVLSFLGVYLLVLTLVGIRQPEEVAGAFRVPDINAALFFALFMLTDPPTSPIRYEHQVIFGALTGALSAAGLLVGLGVFHFPAALLAANAWESWRRPRAPRAAAAGVP